MRRIWLVAAAALLAAPWSTAEPAAGAAAEAADGCWESLGPSWRLLDTRFNHDPLTACGGIGPGRPLVIRAGPLDFQYCTMAFLVTDGVDLYVATAGHCVEPSLGAPGVGDRVSAHGVPGTFGTVVYQWCDGTDTLGQGCGAGADFGLIRIDADKRALADPAMCHWGAPTAGMFTASDNQVRRLQHFGWGAVVGEASGGVVTIGNPATQAREGLGYVFSEPTHAVGQTAGVQGDSGSAVLVDAFGGIPFTPLPEPQALGAMTHIGVGGVTVIQRLDASLERAGQDMGLALELVGDAAQIP